MSIKSKIDTIMKTVDPETVWIKVNDTDAQQIYAVNFRKHAYAVGTGIASYCGKGVQELCQAAVDDFKAGLSMFFIWDECIGVWEHVSIKG